MGFRVDAIDPLPADSVEITLDLPVPPSVNETRKINRAAMGKLSAWRKAADKLVIYQRMRDRQNFKFIPGAFEARIVVNSKQERRDLDNFCKSILDYIVSLRLVHDDRGAFLRRLVVEWGEAPEGVRVTLKELRA